MSLNRIVDFSFCSIEIGRILLQYPHKLIDADFYSNIYFDYTLVINFNNFEFELIHAKRFQFLTKTMFYCR